MRVRRDGRAQRGHDRARVVSRRHGQRASGNQDVDPGARRGMEASAHDQHRSLDERSRKRASGPDARDHSGGRTNRRGRTGQEDIGMRVPERGQPFQVGVGDRIADGNAGPSPPSHARTSSDLRSLRHPPQRPHIGALPVDSSSRASGVATGRALAHGRSYSNTSRPRRCVPSQERSDDHTPPVTARGGPRARGPSCRATSSRSCG